jgi:hypothetical protein
LANPTWTSELLLHESVFDELKTVLSPIQLAIDDPSRRTENALVRGRLCRIDQSLLDGGILCLGENRIGIGTYEFLRSSGNAK